MSKVRSALSSLSAVGFSVLAAVLMAPGCDAGETESTEDNITPEGAESLFDLAGLCHENIERHITVKPQELAAGVVRWQCGDRPGVDGIDDRGQEYCEYFAVSGGKRVDTYADLDPSAPLFCYFTSVYADVTDTQEIDTRLAAELSKEENLGATIDPDLVRMKGRFNTRGAATTLVVDAMNVKADTNRDRQAACYLASIDPANKANAEKLKAACDGKSLSAKAAWTKVTKLGAKIPKQGEATYERYKDLGACMTVAALENGGVDWRMSDPHIAQVVVRANDECKCTYSALPEALEGFLQGTWSSPDTLPAGCRRVKVEGADYQQLTLCEVTPSQKGDLETSLDYSENLQAFCNETFGKDIVMTAPLRAVETAGSCTVETGEFCSEFTKTAN